MLRTSPGRSQNSCTFGSYFIYIRALSLPTSPPSFTLSARFAYFRACSRSSCLLHVLFSFFCFEYKRESNGAANAQYGAHPCSLSLAPSLTYFEFVHTHTPILAVQSRAILAIIGRATYMRCNAHRLWAPVFGLFATVVCVCFLAAASTSSK